MKKCTRCHGKGKVFKRDGYTKADIEKCAHCGGTGMVDDNSKGLSKDDPKAKKPASVFTKNT
jgi:DnaJ-class molecular chaperone